MEKKNIDSQSDPLNFKEHLKQQSFSTQHAHIINRMLSTFSVDTNIVVATVIMFSLYQKIQIILPTQTNWPIVIQNDPVAQW